jgi:hypothetical protein
MRPDAGGRSHLVKEEAGLQFDAAWWIAVAMPHTMTLKVPATINPMSTAMNASTTKARIRAKIPVRGMSFTMIVCSTSWTFRFREGLGATRLDAAAARAAEGAALVRPEPEAPGRMEVLTAGAGSPHGDA